MSVDYVDTPMIRERVLGRIGKWIQMLAALPHDGLFAPPQLRYLRVVAERPEELGDHFPTNVALCEYAFPPSRFSDVEAAPGLAARLSEVHGKWVHCITIQGIAVIQTQRRKGVATKIIKEIIAFSRDNGRHGLVCIEAVMADEMHSLIATNFQQAFTLPGDKRTYYIPVDK